MLFFFFFFFIFLCVTARLIMASQGFGIYKRTKVRTRIKRTKRQREARCFCDLSYVYFLFKFCDFTIQACLIFSRLLLSFFYYPFLFCFSFDCRSEPITNSCCHLTFTVRNCSFLLYIYTFFFHIVTFYQI